MTADNETSTRRVAEPVQVYLRPAEKQCLDRLTAKLETTKSDVLRRGLEALERQVSDPERHPALGIAGIVSVEEDSAVDAARDHDDVLADCEIASWQASPPHVDEPG